MSPTQKTTTPDEDLAARSVYDPGAFAELYDYYSPRIYKYFLYRVGNAYEAEDLSSRVFELVVAKIEGYRKDRAPFKSWLFTIAHNVLVDYIRVKKRNRFVPMEKAGLVDQTARGGGDSPADILIHMDRLNKLLNAIKNLNSRERDLISLKFSAGLTNAAISEITGLTGSNVATIIYRAIKKLRSELDALGWDADD